MTGRELAAVLLGGKKPQQLHFQVVVRTGIQKQLFRRQIESIRNSLVRRPQTAAGKTSIGEKYFNYGGYEEYIGKSFAGTGWESSYKPEVESGAVRMSFADDTFRLVRTVSLPETDQPVMRIESVLTNLSGESVTTALRTHPLLAWSGEAGDVRIEISMPDGSVRSSTVNLEHDKSTAVHGGRCVLTGTDGSSLAYTVEPAGEGALYFCKTSAHTFTLEFLGKEHTLKPGESIRIVQQFTIQTK